MQAESSARGNQRGVLLDDVSFPYVTYIRCFDVPGPFTEMQENMSAFVESFQLCAQTTNMTSGFVWAGGLLFTSHRCILL